MPMPPRAARFGSHSATAERTVCIQRLDLCTDATGADGTRRTSDHSHTNLARRITRPSGAIDGVDPNQVAAQLAELRSHDLQALSNDLNRRRLF